MQMYIFTAPRIPQIHNKCIHCDRVLKVNVKVKGMMIME